MRWGCVRATAFAAALCLVAAAGARAGDGGSAHYLIFSGGDIWRNGGFLHGGLLWSPDGLDRDGFTLKGLISGGSYRYMSGALGNAEVIGRELTAQLLAGWRFIRGKTEFKLFAGLDMQDHRLSPDDPSSRLRGGDTGLRVAFDLWSEPTPLTMLAADGSISTIVNSYSARIAGGWRFNERFWLGPEAQHFASDGYKQTRFGIHVTGFHTGDFEWSAAGGFARDSDARTGAYVRLGVSIRR